MNPKLSADAPAASRGSRSAASGDLPNLDGWRLVQSLGEGHLCCVYGASPAQAPPDRPADYAVKVLRAHWEDDPLAIDLIRREATIGRRVSHPHLVSILSAHTEKSPYFVVMPWLRGETVGETLARRDRLEVPEALWVARQTAEALDALHARGWLHADVKPSNIFHAPCGHVTLLDLGFARPMQRPGGIADRPLMGTYSYLAPELFISTGGADPRSDLYSLGVSLYEMLCGRRPFVECDPALLAKAHLTSIPPDLRTIVPNIPRRVVWLVKRLLAKAPLRRPQSAAEVVGQLIELEIETFDDRVNA